ncbi:hypothetical protein I9054_011255 [Acinetobacter bereziniae]|uniref:Uncharacterized protein n=1 Tax=Acinetobacter bereziniae TaxID=106648 RepID=A0A8I1AGK5_ACIBZ|nr:hypothetical protein [Acinetobacter bereziniae]QQC82820.1 hypothetical protein I9190_10840 [Acinetobacter bereziniae]UUN95964.1 hypothetical protein I9054_011255 [Acinetobacter bereziniae]
MFTGLINNPKALKWLFYTVFIAFLPILIRLIIWLFGNFPNFAVYSISDIYLFSLIVHLSVLHELRHITDIELLQWSEKFITLSEVFMIITMIFILCAFLNEAGKNFHEYALLGMAIFFAFVSFIIGINVFYKICCQIPNSSTDL